MSTEELTEEAALHSMIAQVKQLLVEASRELVPAEWLDEIWLAPKSAVVPNEGMAGAGDLACRMPIALWGRLCAEQRSALLTRVATKSEYGLDREHSFACASDIAHALTLHLPDRARDTVADVRVKQGGCLVITTNVHMSRQRSLNMLHCSACGNFFSGSRGALAVHARVCELS